jgi:carboxypeptidase PM20D1
VQARIFSEERISDPGRTTVLGQARSMALAIAVAATLTGCFGGGRVLQPAKVEPLAEIELDAGGAVERLAEAIRLRTISHQDPEQFDPEPFLELHRHLEKSFPLVHERLSRERVNEYTLLFTWEGTDASLKPALFLAHQDVVPTETPDGGDWTHPPYGGVVADGYVWGRGTLDDKGNLMATLEGAEQLLREGYRPERTLYFAFGHDEEIGGQQGAMAIAALLRERGVELEFVLDEGMAVLEPGFVPGVSKWIAFIGIAEKGYVTFKLTARHKGGHSSQPTKDSAIGQLAEAVVRLEENQMPARLEGPAREMLRHLQRDAGAPYGFVYGNLWLFSPVLKRGLTDAPSSNALIRTTTAVTMIEAGTKENILPTEATVTVNHRLLPGDTVETVERHVRRTIRNDAIEVRQEGWANEPSPVSPLDSFGMRAIVRTIREVYPDAAVAPNLVLGGTDSRHFADLAGGVYRFGPVRFRRDDLARVHGKDERIAIEEYLTGIRFFMRMLETAGAREP